MSLAQRRPRRVRRLPLRFRDVLPEPPLPLPPSDLADNLNALTEQETPGQRSNGGHETRRGTMTTLSELPTSSSRSLLGRFRTLMNKFGLSRVYTSEKLPSHDPEDPYSIDHVFQPHREGAQNHKLDNLFYPYPNESSMRLGDWYWNHGAQKSREDFKQLLSIVGDPSFDTADLSGVAWDSINKELGGQHLDGNSDIPEWLNGDHGWKSSSVTISVPFHGRSAIPGAKSYTVQGFHYRSLISILEEKLLDPVQAAHFHYEPYELLWRPPHKARDIKVHGELFTSSAFLDAHKELQESLPEPGCDFPRVVAAFMFSSDATQLCTFGDTKLWPLYVYFGNESKYRRCQPSKNCSSHAAYFQIVSNLCTFCHPFSRSLQLPEAFKDFVMAHSGGKSLNGVLMTHCQRELFHEQWKMLLDEDFIRAYSHGVVITCCDGLKRRFYPRIFTYSADYPEK